jgi:hypothetical protein
MDAHGRGGRSSEPAARMTGSLSKCFAAADYFFDLQDSRSDFAERE